MQRWFRKPPRGVRIQKSGLTEGLLGAFLMNESAGSKTVDLVSGIEAAFQNSPTWNRGGILFDLADSDYLDCGQAIAPTKALTIITQIRFDETDTVRFASKRSSEAGELGFVLFKSSDNNKLAFNISTDGSTAYTKFSAGAEGAPGEPMVVAATYGDGYMRMYKNGKALAGDFPFALSGDIHNSTQTFWIGGDGYGTGGGGFLIDWFYVWERRLTAEEIGKVSFDPYCMFHQSRDPRLIPYLRVDDLICETVLDDVIFLNEVADLDCESNLSHVSVWKDWGRTNLVSESRIDHINVTQTLLHLHADADITLPALKCEARIGPSARADIELPALQCEAEALCGQLASADVDLPGLTCEASFGGRASMELPSLTAEASGLTGNIAKASVRLPGLKVEAGGDRLQIDADIDLPGLIAQATAVGGDTIRGDADIPALRVEAHAFAGAVASLDELLPALVAEASGYADLIADAEVDLPALVCAASMRVQGRFDGLILRHKQIYRISAIADLDTESVFTEWPPAMP